MSRVFSLSGRTAVVIGATRGIGAAIADALAEAGAYVVVGGRTEKAVLAGAERIRASGGVAEGCVVDITSDASIESAATAWPTCDILVNSAGISPVYKRAESITPREWDEIIATNLTGTFRCTIAFGRAMLARRSGSIINILSVGATVGLPRLAAYSASKAGALGFTHTLAVEWADRAVRVNAIAPAFIRTDMTDGLTKHERLSAEIVGNTPMGRFGDATDVAGAAVYLASDAARFVTGSTLYVDGGWTAR